jgi:hypothetical protein
MTNRSVPLPRIWQAQDVIAAKLIEAGGRILRSDVIDALDNGEQELRPPRHWVSRALHFMERDRVARRRGTDHIVAGDLKRLKRYRQYIAMKAEAS